MDCFDFDNVKAEKAKAMRRYLRLRNMKTLFRYVEVCIALLLVSWFSTRLPVAVRIFAEYFREFCLVLVSPCFVFLAGNAIILTLFVKSGHFSSLGLNSTAPATDYIYDEFVKNNTDNKSSQKPLVDDNIVPTPAPVEFVDEDREIVHHEEKLNAEIVHHEEKVKTITNAYREEDKEPAASSESTIFLLRSQSEILKPKLKSKVEEKPCRELQRSETELRSRNVGSDTEEALAVPAAYSYAEEEDFRRTIEKFIERQRKFQREESLAIVLQNDFGI